jgi:hypothetical protein
MYLLFGEALVSRSSDFIVFFRKPRKKIVEEEEDSDSDED